jgi:hypothetical protein
MSTTATRSRQASAPIGTGHLHKALEDSRDHAQLDAFCAAVGCTPADVSTTGMHLDILHVFDLMRSRGYKVSAPAKASHQPRPGFTTWLVDATLANNGPSVRLGFVTANQL